VKKLDIDTRPETQNPPQKKY